MVCFKLKVQEIIGSFDPAFPLLLHENPVSTVQFFITISKPFFNSQENTLKSLISKKKG